VSGDEILEDTPHEGRLTITDDNELKAANEPDSSQTCQELAETSNVSDETIHLHLCQMGKVYKLSKWIPHELMASNKLQRLAICLSLLSRYNNEPFLDWLLMCDKKWLLYSNNKGSHHWLSSSEHVPHMSKPAIHQQKILLCIWWNIAGILYYEFPPHPPAKKSQGKSTQHNCSKFLMRCSKNSLHLSIAKAQSSFRTM
jgi:histone-lysine N-methyltransferase SETMAR